MLSWVFWFRVWGLRLLGIIRGPRVFRAEFRVWGLRGLGPWVLGVRTLPALA